MARVRLPVIVGFGGINSAGRASGHHAYRRLVFAQLSPQKQRQTLESLAQLMALGGVDLDGMDLDGRDLNGLDAAHILKHTLIRRLEPRYFDPERVLWNTRLQIQDGDQPVRFRLRRQQLPETLPSGWSVTPLPAGAADQVQVEIRGEQALFLPQPRQFEVSAASQLPTGFEPGRLYPSRNHPRGLQMTVYAASDALHSLGFDWSEVRRRVPADQISVYASSAMGQLDPPGTGGMLRSRSLGGRVTSKNCALGLAQMPADFINAYILGSTGQTGAALGACASFFYNLRQGVEDIRAGRARVAVIGAAEAPITAEIMEGYMAMGALATDKELRALDGLPADAAPDFTRACRPFAHNCGFTIGESAQVCVLFDDALAMELGATHYGAATDVFINADGFKKSISGPGVGNYITLAKALAAARALVGEKRLKSGGIVQAHGTGTPQNRVTESTILSRAAATFGIDKWPVVALKAYLGHSLGAAAGDQFNATLGIWAEGIVPGIHTIDEIAPDVTQDCLHFSRDHFTLDPESHYYCIANAKGFGGNNASATMLSPTAVRQMLQARYSKSAWRAYLRTNEPVREKQAENDRQQSAGELAPIYLFDHQVLGDADVQMGTHSMQVGSGEIDLDFESPFADMRF